MSDDSEVKKLRADLSAALKLASRANERADLATDRADRAGRLLNRTMTFDDAVRAMACVLVDKAADAPNCWEVGGTLKERAFLLSVQWLDGKSPQTLLAEAVAERDAAEQARFDAFHRAESWEESHALEKRRADELTAAIRHERATRTAWLATGPACARAPDDVVAAEEATATVLAAWAREGSGA